MAKQVDDQEVTAARISTPVCAEDVFHASMNATAFVNTALRRKTFEVSYPKLTGEEATEMDEANKSGTRRVGPDGAVSKVCESQEVPESRLMSMRWMLT